MLTQEQIQKYLKSPFHCPYCNSTQITAMGCIEPSDLNAFQDVSCEKCGKEWTDEYTVTGITENSG